MFKIAKLKSHLTSFYLMTRSNKENWEKKNFGYSMYKFF